MARIRGAVWRGEVDAKVAALAQQVATFGKEFAPHTDPDFIDEHVVRPAQEAKALVARGQSPGEWWSGAVVEDAWRRIRHAEEAIVAATPDLTRLRRHATVALTRAATRLPDHDDRVVAVRRALDDGDCEELRQSVLVLLRAVNADVARRHQTQRRLRNRLRVLTSTLAAGAVALAAAGLVWDAPPDGLAAVPADVPGATWLSLAVVAGAIGALFSAIPSLSLADATASSFDTTTQQAALKIVIGAWSGPLGVVAVTAGVGGSADGGTDASLAGFLLMAALFGAAQEAVTRFADQRAAAAVPGT